MKLQKTFFILIIFIASFQICFGQDNPKAELIDEFGNINCDDFLARNEGFYRVLQENPGSQGYAVISGKNDELRKKVNYELLIKGAIAINRFDVSRITTIRGAESENFKVQFWQVPPGAAKPDFKESKWNFVFPPQTKPFSFYDNIREICPPISFETVYAEYLNANPQARGHIVIYAKSLKTYNKFRNEARDLLKDIPINRLRFFHIKRNFSDNYANIEYWLVPRKTK